MKLEVTFSELIAQQKQVGASKSSWTLVQGELESRTKLIAELERGIEIPLRDVERQPGGLLAYKGEQVILYIKDTGDSLWTLENDPGKSKKFHLFDCKTLMKMEREGRFERYVVTRRTDGKFPVFWRDQTNSEGDEVEAQLKVCQNCLYSINWRGFRGARFEKRRRIVDEFSIAEFLLEHATFFQRRPSETDKTALPNYYVRNWRDVSVRHKVYAGWRCEGCKVLLEKSTLRKCLHCHHVNGNRRDNSRKNIRVLCALCHREQFLHGGMKVPEDVKSTIVEQRKEQGLV